MKPRIEIPDELKGKLSSEFWKSSALSRTPSSTFGLSPKSKSRPRVDDGYEVARTSGEWLAVDKYSGTHGRVRVESLLGKLEETPAPGHYSPKIDKQSKRETIAPMLTIATKPADHYLEDMRDLMKTRREISILQEPLAAEKKKLRKHHSYKITRGRLSGINIEDMRQALLPGPGTYDCNFAAAERFERPPSAKLKPKRNAAVPRRVILPETLDILESPSQRQPAVHYNLDHDPRKIVRTVSIAEPLPMPKKDVNTCTGPGFYDLDHVLATGEKVVLSGTQNLKKKPIGSFEPYRRAMSKPKFGLTKSSLNVL